MGFIRRNPFVPVPPLGASRRFSRNPLDHRVALPEKGHWAKDEEERALFVENKVAPIDLLSHPVDAVRYKVRRADKLSRVRLKCVWQVLFEHFGMFNLSRMASNADLSILCPCQA